MGACYEVGLAMDGQHGNWLQNEKKNEIKKRQGLCLCRIPFFMYRWKMDFFRSLFQQSKHSLQILVEIKISCEL